MSSTGRHRAPRSRRGRRTRIVAAVAGAILSASAAFAATNWVVGLDAGSNGLAQSATISNLTITATNGNITRATNVTLHWGGTATITAPNGTVTI